MDDDDDSASVSDDEAGERPSRSRGPYRPGPEDTFWLVLLGLIVLALFVAGLLAGGDAGPANQDWNNGWH